MTVTNFVEPFQVNETGKVQRRMLTNLVLGSFPYFNEIGNRPEKTIIIIIEKCL